MTDMNADSITSKPASVGVNAVGADEPTIAHQRLEIDEQHVQPPGRDRGEARC